MKKQKKNKFSGTLKLNGKEYPCEVRDGVPYVNNMKHDEFVDWLFEQGEWTAICDLTIIGMRVVKDSIKGEKSTSYQQMANELYLKKVN